MRFKFSITIIVFLLCIIFTQSTSKYEGVSWNEERKRWQVEFNFHGEKSTYYFDNEIDAIKSRNRFNKKMGITPQADIESGEMPNQKVKEKSSKYKWVTWNKKHRKWYVLLCSKNGNKKYGGSFSDELDAAKKVNQFCKELGIPEENPGIGTVPNRQCEIKKKTSQYKGVFLHQEKWCVKFCLKGENKMYGGIFSVELDAAKRVNQLCEELGIPEKNPEIGAMPYQQWEAHEKTSQYKAVYWHKQSRKWYVKFSKNGNKKYGGKFKHELDAAKRVNQLCEELGIPEKNPGIGTVPNRQFEIKKKTSQYKGVYWHSQKK